jgi:hypothetical protein
LTPLNRIVERKILQPMPQSVPHCVPDWPT